MQELENAYRVLDLEPGASMEEVNQAYKDLVFIWHPDRLPKENTRLIEKAQEKIKQLNQARDYLRTHVRVGSRTSHKTADYRSRTRPYARAYTNSNHRQRSTAEHASQGNYHRRYSNPYQTYQSRYAQSAYGTYGTSRSTGNESEAQTHSTSNYQGPNNSNAQAETAHQASHEVYPNPAERSRDTSTRNPSTYPTSSYNDGWNNYTPITLRTCA